MKIIRYTISGLIIAVVLFKVYDVYLKDTFLLLEYSSSKQVRDFDQKDVRVSKAYVLDNNRWMSFPIESSAVKMRIVTNANLGSEIVQSYEDEWNYQIQYQILDENGDILIDSSHYQNTRTAKYMEPRLNKEVIPAFYFDDSRVPTVPRMVNIDLDGIDGSKTLIRVRLKKKDEQVTDVIMRLYVNDQISLSKVRSVWSRLSKKQRERLARGNVFNHELLSEQEKINLLKNNWHAVGPLGVYGKDYMERSLYFLEKIEGEEVGVEIIPAGLFIRRGHMGILPVPEKGGKVLLRIVSPTGKPFQKEKSEINIKWYGRGVYERSQNNVAWDGEELEIKNSYKGGVLEISALSDMVVRLFMVGSGEDTEITPEPVSVRIYAAQHNSPVEYEIHHAGMKDTPFKVALRYVIQEGRNKIKTCPENIKCYMLDKMGKILHTEKLMLEAGLSLYDKIILNNEEQDISEPTFYYFSLPEDVGAIKFESDLPVFVSAYTRPDDLVVETRVPESYFASTSRLERNPVWFTVRPKNYKQYLDSTRSPFLVIQPRPPEDNEDIRKGLYLLQAYRPQGKWIGNYILIEREEGAPIREHASLFAYKLLIPDQDITVNFVRVDSSDGIEPTLLFVNNQQGPFSIRMYLDQNMYYYGEFNGSTGEVTLPFATYGSHELRVESTGEARLFLNCVDDTHDVYLKRMIYRIGKDGLNFYCTKDTHEREVLSAMYYVPRGYTQNSVLHVNMKVPGEKSNGPVTSRTFLNRKYTIRADNVGSVPVLNTAGKYVDRGQLFFMTLGDDMPPGEYPVTFTLEDGSEGYLALYKITPGSFDYRRFFVREGM